MRFVDLDGVETRRRKLETVEDAHRLEHSRNIVKSVLTLSNDFEPEIHFCWRKDLDGHAGASVRSRATQSATERVSARRIGSMPAVSSATRIISRSAGSAADSELSTVLRFWAKPALTSLKKRSRSDDSDHG